MTAVTESVLCFFGPELQPGTVVLGLVLAISGALLLIGFRTTAASVVFASAKIVIWLSWLGRPAAAAALDSPWVSLYAVAIAIAVALLGPGWFSLDCRLFGPREIILPAPGRES